MRSEAERKAEFDSRRESSTKRGYGKRWQGYRLSFLKRHPLCKACLAEGVTRAATEVDHIEPHKGDMVKFWDKANHQGLCKPHHSRKTATEDSSFAKPGSRG